MAKIFIGTSGWSYDHWKNGVFYPRDLESGKELEYYTQFFDTVELNNTFYHLPKPQTFINWRQRTPKKFLFAVKGSRFITHILKLNSSSEPLKNLLKNALNLKKKLGPIFFQLPPQFEKDKERLEIFLDLLPKKQRFAFEFRHESWFCDEIYQLLRNHQCALIFADTPDYPYAEEITTDFVYLRLHGNKYLYSSKYTPPEIQEWAKKIKEWKNRNLNVYCYFDNDANGNAVENAKELKEALSQL